MSGYVKEMNLATFLKYGSCELKGGIEEATEMGNMCEHDVFKTCDGLRWFYFLLCVRFDWIWVFSERIFNAE